MQNDFQAPTQAQIDHFIAEGRRLRAQAIRDMSTAFWRVVTLPFRRHRGAHA